MLEKITKPVLLEDLGMMYPTETSKQKTRYGMYKCMCGNEFKTTVNRVNTGNTKSCGCHKKIMSVVGATTHGLSKTRQYRTYTHMKDRCYNKNDRKYDSYGGRGIIICDKWLNDFKSFYDWSINNGYEDNLTIDRIDVNGNYEPNNCRWADDFTQQKNKRFLTKSNKSGYRGVSFDKRANKYQSNIYQNKKLIYLGRYKTDIEAAKAYDTYIMENELYLKTNGVLKEEI